MLLSLVLSAACTRTVVDGSGPDAVGDAAAPRDGAGPGDGSDASGPRCDPPAVTLLIDASASMATRDDAGVRRWTTLREALFGSYGRCRDIEGGTGGIVCAAARATCDVVGPSPRMRLSCDAICASSGLACEEARALQGSEEAESRCVADAGTTTTCAETEGRRRCSCRGETGVRNDGALRQVEGRAELALATYTTADYEDPETCLGPAEGTTEPKFGETDSLEAFLETRVPNGGSPTPEALEEVYPALEARAVTGQRVALILIIDGIPSGCGVMSIQDSRDRIALARERGVSTYVVGLGDAEMLRAPLESLAGVATGDSELRLVISQDGSGLRDHLLAIFDAEIACPDP